MPMCGILVKCKNYFDILKYAHIIKIMQKMYIYIGSFTWPLLSDHIRNQNPVDITKSLTCEIIEQSSIFLQGFLSWFHICWSNLWWFHQCSASMLCHPLYYSFLKPPPVVGDIFEILIRLSKDPWYQNLSYYSVGPFVITKIFTAVSNFQRWSLLVLS